MSATSAIRPSSRKRSACFSPSPSMSIAPLLTKCLTCWKDWPGQPARLGQIVKTAPSGFTVGGPAGRALLRRLRLAGALVLARQLRRDHLGDHVAGPHHHHLVALAHVLAGQVLLVVEGRGGDGDAADVDRLQHREGDQVAGAADVPDDVASASSSPSSAGTSRRSPSAARARPRPARARAPARRP